MTSDQSFNDFVGLVDELQRQHIEYRFGQCLFTVLHRHRPDLSEMVRSTTLDPFYRDDDCLEFFEWIEEHW